MIIKRIARITIIGGFATLFVANCSKETVTKTVTDTVKVVAGAANAVLLAGTAGNTKSWALTSITEVDVSGTSSQTNTVTSTTGIPACESDNVFTFSNNAAQNYVQTEGSTMCASTDPSTIEQGSWAFTNDGKSLIIDSDVFPSSSQFQTEDATGYYLFYFILNQGTPLTLTSISSTSLTLTYTGTYTDSSTNQVITYTVTLVFAAK